MMNKIRSLVSGNKTRFINDKYDLDLAQINERIIAMGFPATGFAASYRNPAIEVASYLDENYGGHYKIYNLTENQYHKSLFHGEVEDFPFPDHHAPPFSTLLEIVISIHKWLEADPKNIVAVHCLAGVGRTGTIISSALMFENNFEDAQSALAHFSQVRMASDLSVNMPSQIRYIKYMEEHLKYCDSHKLDRKVPPVPWKRIITKITITDPLNFQEFKPFLVILDSSYDVIYNSAWIKEIKQVKNVTLTYKPNIPVRGDFTIKLYKSKGKNDRQEILRTTNNTAFIKNSLLTYTNNELDGPHKGNDKMKYTPVFTFTCELMPIPGYDDNNPIPLVYPNSENASLIPKTENPYE